MCDTFLCRAECVCVFVFSFMFICLVLFACVLMCMYVCLCAVLSWGEHVRWHLHSPYGTLVLPSRCDLKTASSSSSSNLSPHLFLAILSLGRSLWHIPLVPRHARCECDHKEDFSVHPQRLHARPPQIYPAPDLKVWSSGFQFSKNA